MLEYGINARRVERAGGYLNQDRFAFLRSYLIQDLEFTIALSVPKLLFKGTNIRH